MTDLFLQLCAAVAAAIETLKPILKNMMNVTDADESKTPVYVAVVKLLAMGIGIVGAILFQVDVTPVWLPVPEFGGFIFTGILAGLGSDVAHRLLEILEALSGWFQNRATAKPQRVENVKADVQFSASRSTRSGHVTANSCATIPPKLVPTTRHVSQPTWSSSAAASAA